MQIAKFIEELANTIMSETITERHDAKSRLMTEEALSNYTPEEMFDILNTIRLQYADNTQVMFALANIIGIQDIIDNRIFNGIILALLDYPDDTVLLTTVQGINQSEYRHRYLYELENIDMLNKPLFFIKYITSVIESIKRRTFGTEYGDREQTRMKCSVCEAPTDTKCVACLKGICENHVSLRMKEGYYCKECHDLKVAAMKAKLAEETEYKERITSIKVRRKSKD